MQINSTSVPAASAISEMRFRTAWKICPKSHFYKQTSLRIWLKHQFENHFKWLWATNRSPAQSGQWLHLQLVNRAQEQQTETQKGIKDRRLQTWSRITRKRKRTKQWQWGSSSCPEDVWVQHLSGTWMCAMGQYQFIADQHINNSRDA